MKRHFEGNNMALRKAGVCLALLLLVAVIAYAKIIPYPVTATIFNGGCTASFNGTGDCTLQGDGSGSAIYQNSSSIDSAFAPDSSADAIPYSQWNLSFGPSSRRSVYLTLVPANANSQPIFTGTQSFKATLYSRCFTDSTAGTQQNWTQIRTSDTTCGMRVLFTYGGVNYTLVMSPEQAASGMPATGAATVTCTSGTYPCTLWTDVPTTGVLDPATGFDVSNVANLYNGGASPIGQYYLTFYINLQKQ